MENNKIIKMGIGFATGRKSFQQVLRTYIYNWKECGLTDNDGVHLNLFVAYDLKYSETKPSDYTNVHDELLNLIDDACFIGSTAIQKEIETLAKEDIITKKEAQKIFGGGYAGQRNAVVYFAIKNKMDYLVFLDDDEYPLAVTKTRDTAIWSGQHVLNTHLKYIADADITHGHHCGYISPIPYIQFDDTLTERDFRTFIEAISNDIISWDSIRTVMRNGGVTYADTDILINNAPKEVKEVNGTKFVSGANLCLNLTDPERVNAFYNPPDARGEDTFLSTTLNKRKVLKVPCYTFHDGFSAYNHLLDGVLPIELKHVHADAPKIIERFYRACIGWIRYKPLLLYITQRDDYRCKIEEMEDKLSRVLPNICSFFKRGDFMNISTELEYYNKNASKHFDEFLETQDIWGRLCQYLSA